MALRVEIVSDESGTKHWWKITSGPRYDDQPSPTLGLRTKVSRTVSMSGEALPSRALAQTAGEARLRSINRVKQSLETVRRVWVDGEAWYDVSAHSDAEAIALVRREHPSAARIEVNNKENDHGKA